MSDSQALLEKIAAVRQRLAKAQANRPPSIPSAGSGAPLLSALVEELPALEPEPVRVLSESVSQLARHGALLDGCLNQLSSSESSTQKTRLPRQLTPRARQLLERGRELLTRLRMIDAELGSSEQDFLAGRDPLAAWHRDTVAMVDATLHIVQAFPDMPGDQIRLCDGLELILAAVSQRVAVLSQAMERRRREITQVETLADLLSCLEAGRPIDLKPFVEIGEAILTEARQAAPLRFLEARPPDAETAPDAHWVAHSVACHSLVVAHVAARVIQPLGKGHRATNFWRGPVLEPVLAALIHDCGMLRIPAAILAQSGSLTAEQERLVEDHPRTGAELAGRFPTNSAWLVEAAADHHERLDGTGYPAGKKGGDIGPLSRLLAVTDVYAALAAPRPYRPARETRTALTDTLLLAEQGALDREQAELLLQLSFYPVGSVVELADGAVGQVIIAANPQDNLESSARPVIALLTDSRGQPLPVPQYLDLSRGTGRSVVRSLSPDQRKRLLGKYHPELL